MALVVTSTELCRWRISRRKRWIGGSQLLGGIRRSTEHSAHSTALAQIHLLVLKEIGNQKFPIQSMRLFCQAASLLDQSTRSPAIKRMREMV